MTYKTNRQNHDFQIAYFLAGACHTPDAAYAQLLDLLENREMAIHSADAGRIRSEAKRLRLEHKLKVLESREKTIWPTWLRKLFGYNSVENRARRLAAEADLQEMNAFEELTNINYQAALDEVAFIKMCIDKVQPLRRYAHLPDAQAHQAAQQEEWKHELIHRAENYMLTSGTIPADHLSTMRMHPEFQSAIAPAIVDMQKHLGRGLGVLKHLPKREFELPFLPEPAPSE